MAIPLPPGLSEALSFREWIDRIADRFEAAWKKALGKGRLTPLISSFLEESSGERPLALLAVLVRIDQDYRLKAGEKRTLDDYLAEFPQLRGWEGKTLASDTGTGGLPATHIALPFPVYPPARLPLVPGYELLKELGRGGMGVVYQARQVKLKRLVALKMIRAGASPSAEESARFRQEAEAVARLQHPHIVQIHEVGEHEGQPYLVLEFVAGGTLADKLAGTPQPARQAATLVEILARAVHAAHERGIVHRDLKPANVLLQKSFTAENAENAEKGKDQVEFSATSAFSAVNWIAKISDFGLAKVLDEESGQTKTGAIMGTPSYMAPEQAKGLSRDIGPLADVYALGAILYEMLTGRPPFKGETPLDTVEQVRAQEAIPPRRLQPKVPRDLETICLKCLEKVPGKRYASAADLADDVRRFLAGEPILARPVGRIERLWRWCRRNPARATAAGLLVTAAGAGLAIAIAINLSQTADQLREANVRAETARDEAEHQRSLTEQLNTKLKNEQQQTSAALNEAEKQRDRANQAATRLRVEQQQTQRLSCSLALDQGLTLCEKGDLARGILQLAHSLEIAPPEAHDIEAVIRVNLALWRRQFSPVRFHLPHESSVPALAFSPDGKTLVTGSIDGTARLWQATNGEPRHPPLPHPSQVNAVAFSPDGRIVVTGCGDPRMPGAKGEVRRWDVAKGELMGTPLVQGGPVTAVAFGPQGTFLTGSADGAAQLWDASSGKPVGPPLPHQGAILAVAFSPDGNFVVTASADHTARLWDASGKPRGMPLRHQDQVRAIAFRPDGRSVVTASQDCTAQTWDVPTTGAGGRSIRHLGAIVAVAFSPDGKSVLTGSLDGTAGLWDPFSGMPVCPLLQHQGQVLAVAFSPDGRTVVTGSIDKTARLWDAATGIALGGPLRDVQGVWAVAFSPDSRSVVTGSTSKGAFWWEVPIGTRGPALVPSGVNPRGRAIESAVAFSPDGQVALAGGSDGIARSWNTATGKGGAAFPHADAVMAVAYSPDGHLVLTGSADKTARLWQAATGKPRGPPLPHNGRVWIVAFNPDGRSVLTASEDGTARLWDVATGKPIGAALEHRQPVWAAAFSANGKIVVTGSGDKTARVWDAATGWPVGKPLPHSGAVLTVALSPDGENLLTGEGDHGRGGNAVARLWKVASGRLVWSLPPIQGAFKPVAFSPDGRRVLTGLSRSVRLWEAATGQPIGSSFEHDDRLLTAVFSPDGRLVLTGSRDGTARLWDVVTGKTIGPALPHWGEVHAAVFSPQGRSLLTADQKMARLWNLPPSVQGDAKRIVLWAQVLTRMERDSTGAFRDLGPSAWRERQKRLAEMAGPDLL